MRVAYVTSGDVGAGHIVRGIAIRNALDRTNVTGINYRRFGPPIQFTALSDAVDYVTVTNDLGVKLTAFKPDLVIVDMFWMPLRTILRKLNCPAWLLIRYLPPLWFRGVDGISWNPQDYAKIIKIEPFDVYIPMTTNVETIDPVVVVQASDLRANTELRTHFSIDAYKTLNVVIHSEAPKTLRLNKNLANKMHLRSNITTTDNEVTLRLSLKEQNVLYPVTPWLSGADHITAAAGYNTYWEIKTLGLMDKTSFTARMHDFYGEQSWRSTAMASVTPLTNGADTLAGMIAALKGE